jgi:energy-coupling factor transporter ATP-binding protein EcfA2
MDFYKISMKDGKGVKELYPDFTVGRSKDLMVRAKSFYAVWDEERGLWSTDEYDVQRLVDDSLREYAETAKDTMNTELSVKYLSSFGNSGWKEFRKFMQNVSDNSHQLDEKLTFANVKTKKSNYVSRSLPYSLAPGDYSAWDELVGTLYSVEERAKIEWAIGAIVAGDAKTIQKFIVLYGPTGSGKSTILNIIQKLFQGYTTSFEAKALGSTNGTFATEVFKNNPLVAIQHDGDLSKIEDNTKLNSIIAHEEMTMNEKFKPSYTARVNAFLFMGTNQPVKISDAKSGIIRRLIDVHPSGAKFPTHHYLALMAQIDFELGAIAYHCLDVYQKMGKNYYNGYRPLEMMLQTDIFFNFIEAYYDIFKNQEGTTLKQAYSLYKEYCNETGIERQLPQYKVREELRNYFANFKDRATVDGVEVRSYYTGFTAHPFKVASKDDLSFSLVMDEVKSIFDEECAAYPAQYATEEGTPQKRWTSVKTVLSEIDTSKLHYVQIPENHIVIDFDLKDENGEKSLERNLEAASVWPATYAELSKSGAGVHLHYIYDGDSSELSNAYSDGIEVKVYTGNAALRRKLSKCNNVPVSTINSGLPIKEKKMLRSDIIKSEKGLRDLISKNFRKEVHPGTKSSIDFIQKILDDAYESGMQYDVTDLKAQIIAFANNSTHQPIQALKMVQKMKFKSEETDAPIVFEEAKDDRLVFFDVEVFPNLFVICWKYENEEVVTRMINPTAQEVEALFSFKLVGFFNRQYDNHILWGRYMGYDNAQLYKLSQKIINKERSAMFGEAYELSYADIYDFSAVKKGLKRFEIDLGIHHMELGFPWDEPVAEEDWKKVVEYCVNDVVAEEAVFQDRRQDFVARQILAELSGLTINHTTQQHTARIIFGSDRYPQRSFVYTDLSKEFPGYEFDQFKRKSTYKGEEVGEGGYVYAEPGIYENVSLLDIASMHPTSIEKLNLFGEYTKHFVELKNARLAIKDAIESKDFSSARKLLGGRLKPYLKDEKNAEALSYALKIVINIVYGMTSAKFENPFKDPRNIDNIVAKRGALFMVDLKEYVQSLGFTVAHIKTDSIKIPNATPEIIKEVTLFGKKYGYDFELEATYTKFCLVNDAVYIAQTYEDHNKNTKIWKAVGAQFQHPYVYKTLFTGEPLIFDDYCETKQVMQGAMYHLDFDPLPDSPVPSYKEMKFIGKTGRFVPVVEGSGGGILYRVKDDKSYAVTGTKGYYWIEADIAKALGDDLEIDMSYFDHLTDQAIKAITNFGDFEEFVSNDCE